MSRSADDVLSQTSAAARRLEIQDPQFACRSERYLEALAVGSNDLVVNLAYGLGGLTRRILWRLVPYGATPNHQSRSARSNWFAEIGLMPQFATKRNVLRLTLFSVELVKWRP
jgi:hypothetical protein